MEDQAVQESIKGGTTIRKLGFKIGFFLLLSLYQFDRRTFALWLAKNIYVKTQYVKFSCDIFYKMAAI